MLPVKSIRTERKKKVMKDIKKVFSFFLFLRFSHVRQAEKIDTGIWMLVDSMGTSWNIQSVAAGFHNAENATRRKKKKGCV